MVAVAVGLVDEAEHEVGIAVACVVRNRIGESVAGIDPIRVGKGMPLVDAFREQFDFGLRELVDDPLRLRPPNALQSCSHLVLPPRQLFFIQCPQQVAQRIPGHIH